MEKTTFQGATNEAKAEGGLAEISDHHFCVTGTEASVVLMGSRVQRLLVNVLL